MNKKVLTVIEVGKERDIDGLLKKCKENDIIVDFYKIPKDAGMEEIDLYYLLAEVKSDGVYVAAVEGLREVGYKDGVAWSKDVGGLRDGNTPLAQAVSDFVKSFKGIPPQIRTGDIWVGKRLMEDGYEVKLAKGIGVEINGEDVNMDEREWEEIVKRIRS